MDNSASHTNKNITIRDLYPSFDEEQLQEAEDTWDRYLASTLRVYERICADPEAYAHFKALTAARKNATTDTERSNKK